MKKTMVFVFALLLCLNAALAVSAMDTTVYDYADILTDAQEQRLEMQIAQIDERFGVTPIVVADVFGDGYSIESHMDRWRAQNQPNEPIVLLMILLDSRDVAVKSYDENGAGILSYDVTDMILEDVTPALSDEDYVGAFETFVDRCEYHLNGEQNGYPFPFLQNIGISLVVGLIVAFLVTGIMKGQLKSARAQNAAMDYIRQNSMHVTLANDFFLYRQVSRIRKEKNNSSSGGSRSSNRASVGKF